MSTPTNITQLSVTDLSYVYKINMERKYIREVVGTKRIAWFDTHSMFLNSCTSSAAVGLLVGSSLVHLEYTLCRGGEAQDGRTRWPGRGMLPVTIYLPENNP